jgi:hypothetical protein
VGAEVLQYWSANFGEYKWTEAKPKAVVQYWYTWFSILVLGICVILSGDFYM